MCAPPAREVNVWFTSPAYDWAAGSTAARKATVDIVVSPTTVNFTTQFGAPASALTPGEVVEAQVLQILTDGRARLAVANTIIDVLTTVPLVAGSTVRLSVKNTADGIRLTLVDPSLPNGKAPLMLATDVVTTRATTPATSVSGAAASAAAGTTATAATTVTTTSSPSATSNPLLDAQATSAPPISPAAVSAAALASAVRGAAARQTSMAPLFADLAVAANSPALPEVVRQAAGQVLSLRLPVQDGLTAGALKQAFERSGLFLESNLAADVPAAGPAGDLKAAFGLLRQVLKTWLDADPSARGANNGIGNGATNSLLAELRNAPPLVPGAAPAAVPEPARALLGASTAPAAPPPYRGAPTTAQPEALSALTSGMAGDDIGRVLVRDTDGAIARQTLLQAASVPERPAHTDPAGPRWHFEVPLATPQGTAMAQFEIARDGHAAPAEGHKAAWRARFSIDIEPIGAVHAQVALIGERAAVTLWAERPDSAVQLRDNSAALTDALRQAELTPEVAVRDGSPPRPRQAAAPAGRFLDRAS
jgi:hypothetical protein